MWQRTYLILIKSIGTSYAFFLTGSAIYKHKGYTTTKKSYTCIQISCLWFSYICLLIKKCVVIYY